jgi:sporulation protein YlmC with PRC-barrel domain
MRAIPIAVFSAFALVAAASSAQTTAPQGTSPPAEAKPASAPNPLDAENVSGITGTNVYGSNEENIGHVSDVLMSPETKKIDRLVVSSGGVLGVGSHRVALDLDEFTWDSTKGAFRISRTAEDLKANPEWVEGTRSMTPSTR